MSLDTCNLEAFGSDNQYMAKRNHPEIFKPGKRKFVESINALHRGCKMLDTVELFQKRKKKKPE